MSQEHTVSIIWNPAALAAPTEQEIDLLASVLAELLQDMNQFGEDDES
ncbi:MAG: hypothetical protein LCH90_02430 [Proteobacteria bacterium]|nr:hypothetical protein [Pseudomonadota bacterium]